MLKSCGNDYSTAFNFHRFTILFPFDCKVSKLTFGSTNGDTVRVLPDNGITIQGRFEVEYHFDGES